MIVRTQTEIAKLDEELNLFDENDWDFFDVLETHETNFEYFDDSQDLDFASRRKISPEIKIVLCSICLLSFIVIGGFTTLIQSNDSNFENNYINSSKQSVNYIDGVEADSTALINASNTLSLYFKILESKGDYTRLDECCETKSSFASLYFEYLNSMSNNYDSYDCFSRAMRLFSGLVDYKSVDKVIIKDNIYYVYINVSAPTLSNIEEYWYSIQFNVSKHFSSSEVSESDLEKYLLEVIDVNDVPVSNEVWCLEMREMPDGTFKIISDTKLTELCKTSYTYILDKAIEFLGSSLTN